jgi:hypothetical protein
VNGLYILWQSGFSKALSKFSDKKSSKISAFGVHSVAGDIPPPPSKTYFLACLTWSFGCEL